MTKTPWFAPLTCLVALTAPAFAGATNPYVSADSVVVADGDGTWTLDYRVVNPLDYGFYPDSFTVRKESRDPGVGPARSTTDNIAHMLRVLPSVSGGDSTQLTFTAPASFESGVLYFRMVGHNNSGPLPPLEFTVTARPGPLSRDFPSRFVGTGKQAVEIVEFPPSQGSGAAPGLLLLHADDAHARTQLRLANQFRSRGFGVVLVSLPGSGQSAGPIDWAGPASQKALAVALDALKKMPGVDPRRLGAWGMSRSATALAVFAATHPELRAVALQSACFDPAASARTSEDREWKALLESTIGRDSAAWRVRTPLRAAAPKGAVLVLHGTQDGAAPIADARAYAAKLTAAGVEVTPKWIENRGHLLPPTLTQPAVLEFFRRTLAGATAP